MDNRLQTKVLALAMQIIGIKDPGQFKQAMTMMSEQGRNKFLARCAQIIQSGDASEESIAQAQQEAQQAIQEGQQEQQAILARHGNRITYLNRFYSGGAVQTYDGGYMKLKRPLTKDQLEGRQPLGLYKGKWMYLNGDKVAVPNQNGKQKGDDGSLHINRAYNGMLIPKPQNYIQAYSLGGIFSSVGNWIGNAAKNTGQWLKGAGSTIGKGLNTAANWVDKNQEYINGGASFIAGLVKTIQGMNRSNKEDAARASGELTVGNVLMNYGASPFAKLSPYKKAVQDSHNYRTEQAQTNGSPGSQINQEYIPEGMVKDPYSGQIYPEWSPEGSLALDRSVSLYKLPENPSFKQYSNLQLPDNSDLQNLQFNIDSPFFKLI